MSITLPKLPQPTPIKTAFGGTVLAYGADQLRARDIEVARVVLEAAAMEADFFNQHDKSGVFIANAIRNLKVSHAE